MAQAGSLDMNSPCRRLLSRAIACLVLGFACAAPIPAPGEDHPSTVTARTPAIVLPDKCDLNRAPNCDLPECHPKNTEQRTIRHPLYLENRCLECHVTPQSPQSSAVRARPDSVCQKCHTDVEWNAAEGHPAHPPGKEFCVSCHNPHESRVRNLLRDEKHLAACTECHQPFLLAAQSRPYQHQHFDPRTQCGSCHYAHLKGQGKYLRKNVSESCLTCHDMPILVKGRMLASIAEQLRDAPVKHKALDKGACPVCHTSHGSDQPALLRPGYPAGNYAEYKSENYALCWQCHSAKLVDDPRGEGNTNFSNGAVNLHRKHVLDVGRGRACHVCHQSHVSERPYLLRDDLSFRSWTGPFGYDLLPDGGRCQTPCHREKDYHRVKAWNLLDKPGAVLPSGELRTP